MSWCSFATAKRALGRRKRRGRVGHRSAVMEAISRTTLESAAEERQPAAPPLAPLEREWLETDGLGGWSGSTLAGAHSRRYHGALVAATLPPAGRRVLLSRLEETLVVDGARIEFGCNRYPGAIHPRGDRYLIGFGRELFPHFDYEAGGVRIRKRVAALAGGGTLVEYELLAAPGPVELELRPFLAGRDIHSLGHAEPSRVWRATHEGSRLLLESAAGEPAVAIEATGARFEPDGDWYRDLELAEERARGFDFHEDLWTPGRLRVVLAPGCSSSVRIALAAAPPGAPVTVDGERARREALIERAGFRGSFGRRLALAADQFLVRRGDAGWSVIAGYPWFADWGRDAMIALPGLCLPTGRFDEARGILAAFCAHLSQGMLPNRFPEAGEAPEYNTVDATLWLFVAAWRYLEATRDEAFARETLLPALDDVLAWHARGTRYGIRIDVDGLLLAGEPGVQLTWMDARVGDRVITPRHGKPVEIQALWANALWIAAALHRRYGDRKRAGVLSRLVTRVRQRFEALFWNEAEACLYDVVGPEGPDSSVRPNQIFALSLPCALLPNEKALAVLARVERDLVTPRGLRSLAPGHPDYVARYEGGPEARDAAYHQGTVWSWLAGPWIDALVRYRGASGRKRARAWLAAFEPHLDEACVGQVSEIFDAEAPHLPRGAVAQAWSVGELLRALARVGEP